MKSLTLLRVATFACAAAALIVIGCSDDSTQPKETPKPRYPEATTKDIVISNLLLSFKDCNIEQFEKLLHQDYVWFNQASSAPPEYYTRDEDIAITRDMFLAARHLHPESKMWLDKLELELAQPGTWIQIIDIGGVACEDCWETTREYYFMLMMAGGAVTYIANDLVKVVVVPVEANGTKLYKIIRCYDLPRPI
jgi:hypothetical protein